MIFVERNDPHHPQATALLTQSHALMRSLFPAEDSFFLNIDDLAADNVRFFTARKGSDVVGTGALKLYKDYGEIKSIFVAETARRMGVADAILRQLEDQARAENLSVIKLETGDVLEAAHKLYARHEYEICGVFGQYVSAKRSIFMEKKL
jgi:putative acetyltransferase